MKNKRILSLVLSLFMMCSTVACTNSTASSTNNNGVVITSELETIDVKNIPETNKGLTESQVLENLKKSLDKLKSSTATYKVKVAQLDDTNNEVGTNELDITSKIIYSDKKDDNGYSEVAKMYDKTIIDGDEREAYVDLENDKIYLNDDGNGFVEYTGEDMKAQTEGAYPQIARILIYTATLPEDIKMTMTESDKTYDFKYAGKNGNLFYAVDGLFGLGIDLNALDDAQIDITYKISKVDFSIAEIIHEVRQTYNETNYHSLGVFNLISLNDITEIEEAKNIK